MATYNPSTGGWDVYGTDISGNKQRQISFYGFGLGGSGGGTSASGKSLAQLLEEANAANEARYKEGLGWYDQMANNVQGFGNTAMERIGRNETMQHGAAEQSLISRGLGNSTVVPAVQRGISSDAEFARTNVNEQQARAMNDVISQRVGWIGARSDIGPNLGMYAQYQQGASSAPYGTYSLGGSSKSSGTGGPMPKAPDSGGTGGPLPKDNYYDQFSSPVSASTQAYLDKLRAGQTGSMTKEQAADKLRSLSSSGTDQVGAMTGAMAGVTTGTFSADEAKRIMDESGGSIVERYGSLYDTSQRPPKMIGVVQ